MSMSVPITRRAALLGGGLLALALPKAAHAAAPENPPENLVVRLDFTPWGLHGAMHLAQVKGWFTQAGLAVQVQDGTGSGATIQLTGTGQVDVGQVQLGVMAIGRQAGLDVTSIAGFFRRSDLAVLVDRGSPIRRVADLRGHRLVNFNNSPWAPYIDAFLRTGGLDRSSVTIINVAPAALLSAYIAHQADGVFTTAPFGEPILEKLRPSQPVLMADAGIAFPSYGLITTPAIMAAKSDALRRLVAVQVRAWDYIYASDAHITEAVAAIQAQRPGTNLDAGVLGGQIAAYRDFISTPATMGHKFGWQADADWLAAIGAMTQNGVIQPGHTPQEFYTNALLPA